jgi:hypothetical protein
MRFPTGNAPASARLPLRGVIGEPECICHNAPPHVHRPPQLIAQLLSLADRRGEGFSDVARVIGCDDTTLMHYRSGRRRLSMQAFANILAKYGEDQGVCAAAIYYAQVEYHPPAPGSLEAAALALAPSAADALRRYVDRLPEESLTTGRGLYLCSADARCLSVAVQFLVRSFERARTTACHLRADRPVTAADRRFALSAAVLVVERVDFVRDAVADLLRERATLVRPLIVTSMAAPETVPDTRIRRIFLSLTPRVDLDPLPILPTDGSVPAESEQQ